MVRVNPKTIRHCRDSGDYWVVNGLLMKLDLIEFYIKNANDKRNQFFIFVLHEIIFKKIILKIALTNFIIKNIY